MTAVLSNWFGNMFLGYLPDTSFLTRRVFQARLQRNQSEVLCFGRWLCFRKAKINWPAISEVKSIYERIWSWFENSVSGMRLRLQERNPSVGITYQFWLYPDINIEIFVPFWYKTYDFSPCPDLKTMNFFCVTWFKAWAFLLCQDIQKGICSK